jgi:DNA gyrase/topoisomerase IV subunit B
MIPELIFGHLLTSSNYDKSEEKIVGGKNGYGSKCLGLYTKILLWSSEVKTAENIKVGDILIGDDGTPRKVLNTIRGNGQMYEIQQAHGDPYMVNDEHILTLHMPDHKVIFWNTTQNGWSVLWWDNENKKISKKSMNETYLRLHVLNVALNYTAILTDTISEIIPQLTCQKIFASLLPNLHRILWKIFLIVQN